MSSCCTFTYDFYKRKEFKAYFEPTRGTLYLIYLPQVTQSVNKSGINEVLEITSFSLTWARLTQQSQSKVICSLPISECVCMHRLHMQSKRIKVPKVRTGTPKRPG